MTIDTEENVTSSEIEINFIVTLFQFLLSFFGNTVCCFYNVIYHHVILYLYEYQTE